LKTSSGGRSWRRPPCACANRAGVRAEERGAVHAAFPAHARTAPAPGAAVPRDAPRGGTPQGRSSRAVPAAAVSRRRSARGTAAARAGPGRGEPRQRPGAVSSARRPGARMLSEKRLDRGGAGLPALRAGLLPGLASLRLALAGNKIACPTKWPISRAGLRPGCSARKRGTQPERAAPLEGGGGDCSGSYSNFALPSQFRSVPSETRKTQMRGSVYH